MGCRTGTDVRTQESEFIGSIWTRPGNQKYRTLKAVGPEKTHESEFIGSFRSLKTSGEPKKNMCNGLEENGQKQSKTL